MPVPRTPPPGGQSEESEALRTLPGPGGLPAALSGEDGLRAQGRRRSLHVVY